MDTREIVYYQAETVYAMNSKAILVKNIASNNKWPPLYTMRKIGKTTFMSHGTEDGLIYVVNPIGSEKKNITREYAKSFYPFTFFPQCNVSIYQREFEGNASSDIKDYKEFGLQANSLNELKSSGLGYGDDLCNGVDILMTSSLKHYNVVYIKDKSNKDGLVYSMYEFKDNEWGYIGEDQLQMKILKYSLMPFAFALDIVTSPIQLFMIATTPFGPGR